jgi:hypothetical protein
VGTAWVTGWPRLGWRPITSAALAAVEACPGPLYNRYNEGGYLIWFAPRVPVFIDSRQDPYPLALLLEHIAVEDGAPYGPLFQRFGIRCAFLPTTSVNTKRLAADAWTTTYRDEKWAVLVAPADTRGH